MIKLDDYEYIDSCYVEYCKGPGWSNWILWVYIGKRGTNEYRKDSLQFDEIKYGYADQIVALAPVSNSIQPFLKNIALGSMGRLPLSPKTGVK